LIEFAKGARKLCGKAELLTDCEEKTKHPEGRKRKVQFRVFCDLKLCFVFRVVIIESEMKLHKYIYRQIAHLICT